MKAGCAEALRAIEQDRKLWSFTVDPETLGVDALAAIPSSADAVALHSNPGPEHVFVDPNTHQFTGLIEFGDAYLGHPALDCRWPAHDDRLDLLQGYYDKDEAPDEFMGVWRAVRLLTDMAALATRPERRVQSIASLGALIAELS